MKEYEEEAGRGRVIDGLIASHSPARQIEAG